MAGRARARRAGRRAGQARRRARRSTGSRCWSGSPRWRRTAGRGARSTCSRSTPRATWRSRVSTSGYPWKYPGRVGDSALIGAGNYCDNRVGAAACTGRGELAIRARHRPLRAARAAGRARTRPAPAPRRWPRPLTCPTSSASPLQALCLTPDGRHGGASTRPGATYSVMTASDDSFRIEERRQI